MLVLPMERTFSIKKLPVVTFLLLLFNTIIYFTCASNDETLIDSAVSDYISADIMPLEYPYFTSWAKTNDEDIIDYLGDASTESLDEYDRYELVYYMLVHSEYNTYLSEKISDELEDPTQHWISGYEYDQSQAKQIETYQKWQERQVIVSKYIDSLSSKKYGYNPAEWSVATPFTSQFMHGGVMHLLGNMVILFLIGMTVEQLLGSFTFTLFYLLSGAVGALLYGLVHWGESTVLVGASGSISGVMGMYVASYGTRKIRFFYSLGVYFNYFRGPALIMLPVWVGKEVFDYFFTDSNVAYMAHAGGLVAGAGLVLAGKGSWAKVDADIIENKEEGAEYRRSLDNALSYLRSGELKLAKSKFRELRESYPADERVWLQLYHLEKLAPKTKQYHIAVAELLSLQLRNHHLDQDSASIIQNYIKQAKQGVLMNDQLVSRLVMKLLSLGDADTALALYDAKHQKGFSPAIEKELLTNLKQHFQFRDEEKAKFFTLRLAEMGD